MNRVELSENWQGGPAWLEVEGDVIDTAPDGSDVPGVILRVTTEAELGAGDDEAELELGAGRWKIRGLRNARTSLQFSVAASDEQARALIAALKAEIEVPE